MKIVKQLFDEHIRDEVLHPYDEYVSRITTEPPFFLGLVLWAYITGFPLVGCCDTLMTKPVLSLILFSVTLLLLALGFGFSISFLVYCNKHYKDKRVRMLASNDILFGAFISIIPIMFLCLYATYSLGLMYHLDKVFG